MGDENTVFGSDLLLTQSPTSQKTTGEELFLDYGSSWEEAWQNHMRNWKPYHKEYAYPRDEHSSIDGFRTLEEQKLHPYAINIATACWTPNWDRDTGSMEWHEPDRQWPEGIAACYVLDRKEDDEGGGSDEH
ncbi:MAG: hypothetical protein SGARI_003934 [Bacillariaceae sp.]